MTPETFKAWLADMKAAGLARSDAAAARLIGITPHTLVNWKERGIPDRYSQAIALGFTALLHRLEPYK